MSTDKSFKVIIIEPCALAQEGKATKHLAKGETHTLLAADAMELVGNGKAVLSQQERFPNALKGEK